LVTFYCSATHGDTTVPRSRMRYGHRSFVISGPTLWNSLPPTVHDPTLTLTPVLYTLEDLAVLQNL